MDHSEHSSFGQPEYWRHSVHQFIRAANEKTNQIIDDYLSIVYGDNPGEETLEKIESLPSEYIKAHDQNADDIKDKHAKIRAAVESYRILLFLKNTNLEDLDKWKLAQLMITLGSYYQMMTSNFFSLTDINPSKEFAGEIVGIGNRLSAITRHRENKELYNDAILNGKSLWKRGDTSFHNEMAKYLCSLPEYKTLNAATLRKRLIPTARAYGRVLGDKGVKRKS